MNMHRTWTEINLETMRSNLLTIRSNLGPMVTLGIVVKADAYGHGLRAIVPLLNLEKIEFAIVAYVEEALVLRQCSFTGKILVLNEVSDELCKAITEFNLTLCIGSYEYAKIVNEYGRKLRSKVNVHIEIDTGIGRSGLYYHESLNQIEQIVAFNNLEPEGIFTHFSNADSKSLETTTEQLRNFKELVRKLSAKGIEFKYTHAATGCSAFSLPDSQLNLVRIGAAFYGLQSSNEKEYPIQVRPVLSWFTRVSRIRRLRAGENLGYGINPLPVDSKIAVLPIGYGDGFSRRPNFNFVLIRSHRVPIIGHVSMSEAYADVTGIGVVEVGDTVTIIGKQGKTSLSAQDHAKSWDTVSEEIVASISPLVPRIYLSK
ncbi:alanine racemase [candidate division WWE3 bacterium RIFOXYC1_FULL_39_7]|uniref:Alanine racemase n=1 Tax=candidate division WWE3 bacterium RIFOXYC1_FULL_39_7 TaxID=1802643 RepID=A0A1F4WHN0_UNCKA|nr:MAG: alanine racemase [candidate division WWE3 bacterium RIFOXYC1_FULL_39_7]